MHPITFTWTDEGVMAPLPRLAKLCDRQYVVGETYQLAPIEQRSSATHRHYFAALHDAWQNLPEHYADRWPTSEHFRKWLLVQAGYSDERSIVCSSKAEAQRVAAFVKPLDQYAVVIIAGPVVKVFTAQSQSVRAMGAKVFQDSKQKVLDIAASMIGVEPGQLGKAA